MRKEFVYFIQDGDQVKIGRSYSPTKRLFQLRLEKTKSMKIIKTIEFETFEKSCLKEQSLHAKFKHLNTSGEWFKLDSELKKEIEGML